MPVPPIYVVEEESGKYVLIDGLQRMSSYLHLRGELQAPHLNPPIVLGKKLILSDCDIVEELNGKSFDDLGTALQIRLKRSFVRVEVVRKGSDPRFKYHMFKRLNTGGELLTAQQLRNCTIRLLDPKFNDLIIELSNRPDFCLCTGALTDEKRLDWFDKELVLRFFAMKNRRDLFKHDVEDFLTEYMESVSDPAKKTTFDYVTETQAFVKTFRLLAQSLGEKSFAYANKARTELTSSFSVYHFEAITLALQMILEKIDPSNETQVKSLQNVLRAIKIDPAFIALTTGGGKNSSGQLATRINYVQERLEKAF